jgi:hypothetical protein
LESFIYIGPEMAEKIFFATFHALSNEVASGGLPYYRRQAAWLAFRSDAVFVHPTGEEPNDSDSGYHYKRLARKSLLVPEEAIVSNAEALGSSGSGKHLIFVDDFSGSGNQFLETWTRDYGGQGFDTFEEAAAGGHFASVLYIPLIMTADSRERISLDAPAVKLRPGHVLPQSYGIGDPGTILMPDDLRPSALSVVRQASKRAGICAGDELGFWDLGLAIAFEDSIPDATLPIFYHESSSWTPLLKRR